MKEESSSSEDDDEDEEEEQEEDASGEEEEVRGRTLHMLLSPQPPSLKKKKKIKKGSSNCLVSCLQEEVEPFPEERENFLQQLYKFMEDRGERRVQIKLMFTGFLQNKCFIFSNAESLGHIFFYF